MDKLPAELHHNIYELACLDDGSTGCALSAVSQYVRAHSAKYRYRCIALTDNQQVTRFHELVKRGFQEVARGERIIVRHLYVSLAPTRSRQYQEFVSNAQLALQEAHVDTLRSLLEETAQHLETLSLSIPRRLAGGIGRAFMIPGSSLSFPRLEELTVWGRIPMPRAPSFAPRLRRLHIITTMSSLFPLAISLSDRQFPCLTHLCITACNTSTLDEIPEEAALRLAGRCVGYARMMGVISSETARTLTHRYHLRIPESGENNEGKLFLVRHFLSTQKALLGMLQSDPVIWAGTMDRFIALPPRPAPTLAETNIVIKDQWLDRISGRLGCWGLDKQSETQSV